MMAGMKETGQIDMIAARYLCFALKVMQPILVVCRIHEEVSWMNLPQF